MEVTMPTITEVNGALCCPPAEPLTVTDESVDAEFAAIIAAEWPSPIRVPPTCVLTCTPARRRRYRPAKAKTQRLRLRPHDIEPGARQRSPPPTQHHRQLPLSTTSEVMPSTATN
jgi:hypothetical protein